MADIVENLIFKDCGQDYLCERAEEFSAICREAFADYLKANVQMGPCTMTSAKFKKWANNCIGVYAELAGRIVAFWTVRLTANSKTAHGIILAVLPEFKGRRIGSLLTSYMLKKLVALEMDVFVTDTSINLPRVVAFHRSYGCKEYQMRSHPNTNYYSVFLRLGLNPESEISEAVAARNFRWSKRCCRLFFKEDGRKTFIARLCTPIVFVRRVVLKLFNS